MLNTITYTEEGEISVISANSICIVGEEIRRVPLESSAVLVHGNYIVTEKKDLLKLQKDTVSHVGKVKKIPTKMCIVKEKEKEMLFISDRLGTVQKIVFDKDTCIEELCFGSISMITDLFMARKYFITVDKDSKIRITHAQAPYMIEKFVLAHSKPLVSSICICDKYIISGGYDSYLSIYNIQTKAILIYDIRREETVKFDMNALPGVSNPAEIANIAPDAVCQVKKILYASDSSSNTLLLITEKQPIALSVAILNDTLYLSPIDIPEIDGIFICDGVSVADKNLFFVIERNGQIYRIENSNRIIATYLIESYCPDNTSLQIINKCRT